MCGPAGSGKSTLAGRLEAEGYARLSFDEVAWGRGHRAHPLPAAAAREVHDELRERLVSLVQRGADVVVDSSFWSRASRSEYRELLAQHGVEPVTYYLATPRDVALARVAGRAGAGPHDVTLPAATAGAHVDGFEVPTADEGPLHVVGWAG